MKISVITVLYNQKLVSSAVWKTLLEPALKCAETEGKGTGKTGIRVVAADNSTDPGIREENRRSAEEQGVIWLDMEGNKGLPAAYNRSVDRICGMDRTDRGEQTETDRQSAGTCRSDSWIVPADQDTSFPAEYLSVLMQEADRSDASVLFPEVRSGEKQLSPCRKKGDRFVPYGPADAGEETERSAFSFFINTGLALKQDLFAVHGIRYDERIFLDFADFDLISQIRSRTEAVFRPLPGIVLQQAFSGTEARTAEQDLERFRHFAEDGRVFYEKWYGKKEAAAAIRSRALRLAAKHRDIRFLKKN